VKECHSLLSKFLTVLSLLLHCTLLNTYMQSHQTRKWYKSLELRTGYNSDGFGALGHRVLSLCNWHLPMCWTNLFLINRNNKLDLIGFSIVIRVILLRAGFYDFTCRIMLTHMVRFRQLFICQYTPRSSKLLSGDMFGQRFLMLVTIY